MKFHIRTLGCKVNWLDSARLTAALQAAGHQQADEAEADYVFINSCTVTAEADRKSRSQANAARRKGKQVAVMGCGPRVDHDKWQQRDDDTLIFSDEEAMLAHFGVELESIPFPINSRVRLPVSVQAGCDNLCTFCITRVARGPHRNIPAVEVVAHIREAEAMGIKEVILTGVNLAAWGCEDSNRPEQARLHELVEAILKQTTIPRIRFSSLGPQFIQPAFWDLYSDPRICDYLHLSLQSGSPTVLARMVRGHGTAEVLRIAEEARERRPDTAMSADLIAGFPGESEAEHAETLAFIEQVRFAKLHVFPYSIREGTPAAEMTGQLPGDVKKARARDIREAGRRLREAFLQAQLGHQFEALAEKGQSGLTSNYIRVKMPGVPEGEIRTVRLSEDNLAERAGE